MKYDFPHFHSDEQQPANEFANCISRLRSKHSTDIPDFKIKIWAKMLVRCVANHVYFCTQSCIKAKKIQFLFSFQVNGTHNSENLPPQLPFFTGKRLRSASAMVTSALSSIPASEQQQQGHTAAIGVENKVLNDKLMVLSIRVHCYSEVTEKRVLKRFRTIWNVL